MTHHVLADAQYPVSEVVGGQIISKNVPALTALNERLSCRWTYRSR